MISKGSILGKYKTGIKITDCSFRDGKTESDMYTKSYSSNILTSSES